MIAPFEDCRLFIVMGVCGTGKSSIAEALARHFGGHYLEGDNFHPAENVEKMRKGIALSDDDRWAWLSDIAKHMSTQKGLVYASCSALRQAYRAHLVAQAEENIGFILLDGSRELILQRMGQRQGHYMPTSLLDSQLDLLEYPDQTERSVTIDISGSKHQVEQSVIDALMELNLSHQPRLGDAL